MANLIVRVGSSSARGRRPNNEDAFVADAERHVFLVADGMGGQELGERASSLAAEIIPRIVRDRLAVSDDAAGAVKYALAEANHAIVNEGRTQPPGRRMGTTAVLAVRQNDQVFVAGLGDSRAYLVRGDDVLQLTEDHSVARALELSGTLTAEQARHSPWQHVLYKFLGCAEMTDGAEVRPFTPLPGDRLILASDGLTNHICMDDLRAGAIEFSDPQSWADQLVPLALQRGSSDNVTCVVVAFDQE